MPSWRRSLAACVLIADSAQGFATFPQISTFARLRGGTLAWKGNALSAMNGRKTLRQHVRTSWRCQLPPQEEDAGTGVAPASSETLLGMTKLDGGETGGSVGAQIERTLLKAVTASGVFMFLWVFVLFPGSAYTGFAEHDKFIEWLFAQDGPIQIPVFRIVAPVSLITKYNELGHLPAFTHAVPGAIWSLLAPLQLLPEARARLGASWHSVAGRTMLTAAAVLMVGYGIIDANDLYSDTHDFQGHGGGLAAWVDSLKLLPLPMNLLGVRFLAAYFVASGLVCVVSLRACVGDVPLWQVRRACGSVHLSLSLYVSVSVCACLCAFVPGGVHVCVCACARERVVYVCVVRQAPRHSESQHSRAVTCIRSRHRLLRANQTILCTPALGNPARRRRAMGVGTTTILCCAAAGAGALTLKTLNLSVALALAPSLPPPSPFDIRQCLACHEYAHLRSLSTPRPSQAAVLGTEASGSSAALGDAFYYAAYTTTLVYILSAEFLARRPGPVKFPSSS